MTNIASVRSVVSLHFEVYKYAFLLVDLREKSDTENEKSPI